MSVTVSAPPKMTSMVATAPSMVLAGMPTMIGGVQAGPTMQSMVATGPQMVSMYQPAAMQQASPMPTAPGNLFTPTLEQMGSPGQQMSSNIMGFAPAPPGPLTEGMKGPELLEKEKLAYHRALERQLAKESEAVTQEGELQKAMVEMQAKNQIAQFTLQVEEQLKLQCMQIDNGTANRTAALMEAAVTQRTMVDEKSAIATMEFQKKKAKEDMAQRNYLLQKQFHEAEVKMMAEFRQVAAAGQKVGVFAVGGDTKFL